MKLISVLLFIALSGCAHKPVPHTYLKYSGYVEGCTIGMEQIILATNTNLTSDTLNMPVLDALCMDLYLIKLETEDIKPPIRRLDRNEMI